MKIINNQFQIIDIDILGMCIFVNHYDFYFIFNSYFIEMNVAGLFSSFSIIGVVR